jgi:hypothetical protein
MRHGYMLLTVAVFAWANSGCLLLELEQLNREANPRTAEMMINQTDFHGLPIPDKETLKRFPEDRVPERVDGAIQPN